MGRMHTTVYGLLPDAQIVAVVDKDAQRAEEASKKTGAPDFASLSEALAAVPSDVVDVCLPTYLHSEAAIKAMEAGRHVFCEKPMALTVEDADAMITASERNGVRLMIGHCIRFWPEYTVVEDLVRTGRFGKLLSLNLTRYGEFPHWSSDNWLADESKAGGGALDMHIHDTDWALHLLGEPAERISWGTQDSRGVSHIFSTFHYEDGTIVHLEGGWNLPPKTPFRMAFRAIFERGAAIMDGGPLVLYPATGEPKTPAFEAMSAEGGGNISDLGGYFHELDYFIRALETGGDLKRCTPESARRSLAVTLSEIQQAKSTIAR